MNILFSNSVPAEMNIKPILLSTNASANHSRSRYLIIAEGHYSQSIFEIRYDTHCSPFESAIIVDDVLAAGHEEHFYLYDLESNQNLFSLKLNGYFGHIYVEKGLLYVTDAEAIYCIDLEGQIKWKNAGLSVDGVTINGFEGGLLSATGTFDPPDNNYNFILDSKTGQLLK